MKITITEPKPLKTGALVIGVLKGGRLLSTGKQLDKISKGTLSKAIKGSRFEGEIGQHLDVIAPVGIGVDRVLMSGLGEAKNVKASTLEKAGGSALQRLYHSGVKFMTITCDPITGSRMGSDKAAASLAYGAYLASYRFDKYRTTLKDMDNKLVCGHCRQFSHRSS